MEFGSKNLFKQKQFTFDYTVLNKKKKQTCLLNILKINYQIIDSKQRCA